MTRNLRRDLELTAALVLIIFVMLIVNAGVAFADIEKSAHDSTYKATEHTQEQLITLTGSITGSTEDTYTLPAWNYGQGNNPEPDYPKQHIVYKNASGDAITLRISAESSKEFQYWKVPGSMYSSYDYTNCKQAACIKDAEKDSSTGKYVFGTRVIYLYPNETYTVPLQHKKNSATDIKVTVDISVEPPRSGGAGTYVEAVQGGDSISEATPIDLSGSFGSFGGFWGMNWYSTTTSGTKRNMQYYKFTVSKRSVYRFALDRVGGSKGNMLQLFNAKGESLNSLDDFELTEEIFSDKTLSGADRQVTLDPGTYYLAVTNPDGYNNEGAKASSTGNPRTFSVTVIRRDYIPSTGIKYTAVKAVPSSIKYGKTANYSYKVELLPANTDDRIYDPATKAPVTSLTVSGTYKGTQPGAKKMVLNYGAYQHDMNITSDASKKNVYNLKYTKAITTMVLPPAPSLNSIGITSYYNKAVFKNYSSNQIKVYLYKGKKWVFVKTVKAGSSASVGKLKANTNYKFKFRQVQDGATGDYTSAVKVKTGVKSAPKIKSVKVSNVTVKSYWVKGYWNSTFSRWTPGYYQYRTSYKVKVTLKKKLKGTKGLIIGASYVKGTGKTFTTTLTRYSRSGGLKGKKVPVSVRGSSDKKHMGYSKGTASKNVTLR